MHGLDGSGYSVTNKSSGFKVTYCMTMPKEGDSAVVVGFLYKLVGRSCWPPLLSAFRANGLCDIVTLTRRLLVVC